MVQWRERIAMPAVAPGNRLLDDYLSGRYALDRPHDGEPRRAGQLCDALAAYQERLGADAAAVANARRLADPAVPVVTAGQQPGLLTGPLYTPLKALTAIALARRLGAVPVFWVGSDDDDRAEVDHCACWDARGRLHALRYPEDAGAPGQLIGDLPVRGVGERVLAQLAPLLDGLPHGAWAMALAEETLEVAEDFGEWFARLLSRLCSPLGLVLCDPRLPAVRAAAVPVLHRELAAPLHTTALVNAAAARLRHAGYEPALTKPDDACNVFYFDGVRHRVTYRDGLFHAAGRAWTADGLRASAPGRLLPNAVLRPVVQEALFGSTVFVAGPHELGYWLELPEVFRALRVPMPAVAVRAGATVLTAETAAALREADLSPLRLLHDYDFEAVRFERLAAVQPPALSGAFTDARTLVERLSAGLAREMARLEPTLAGSVQASHQKMLHEIERLEHKALKAVERRTGEATERLERLREAIFPGRGLQERLLNVFALLARAGPAWTERWLNLLDGQEGCHLFVELEHTHVDGSRPRQGYE